MIAIKRKTPADWPSAEVADNLLLLPVDLHNSTEYCTTNALHCQDPFDRDVDELESKFKPKRLDAEKLSASFYRLEMVKRGERVADCGTFLEFAHACTLGTGEVDQQGKLHFANFCKDRLCPMCSWRRSYKIYAQVSKILDKLGNNYVYLMLTLTVPNVEGSDLSQSIDDLMLAWHRLTHRKRFKNAVKGFFRALEITRNDRTGKYHPHFHCILAVGKRYLKDSDYIPRNEWLQMWQQATKDPTITQVDIRVARSKNPLTEAQNASQALASAVAEIAKYTVKSADYILSDDKLTDSIVSVLAPALHGRRLAHFGGCFAEAAKALKLDDPEDGDLIHIDEDTINPEVAWMIVRYQWSCGVYKMVHTRIQTDDEKEI